MMMKKLFAKSFGICYAKNDLKLCLPPFPLISATMTNVMGIIILIPRQKYVIFSILKHSIVHFLYYYKFILLGKTMGASA